MSNFLTILPLLELDSEAAPSCMILKTFIMYESSVILIYDLEGTKGTLHYYLEIFRYLLAVDQGVEQRGCPTFHEMRCLTWIRTRDTQCYLAHRDLTERGENQGG